MTEKAGEKIYLTARRTPHDELIIQEVNANDFDSKPSQTIHHKRLEHIFHDPDHFQVIVGSDSGLLLDNLASASLPEGSRFLVVELPEVLEWLVQTTPERLRDLPENVRVTDPDSWSEQAQSWSIQDYCFLGNIRLTNSIATEKDHLQRYTPAFWQVEEQLQNLTWKLRTSLGTATFVERQLMNLSEARQPAVALKGHHAGQNALLLAGGPSLDQMLPWILENRENLILVAVSRISKRLREFGITPDYLVSVDPKEISFQVSKDMLLFDERTTLIYAEHANTKLVRNWPHKAYYVGDIFPWPSDLNKPANPRGPGPTVTNAALHQICQLGFAKVLLCGVDLCYAQSGVSHAQGSMESKTGPAMIHRLFSVKTYEGETADTNLAYLEAAKTLDSQALGYRQKGTFVFNASKQAIELENIPFTDNLEMFLNKEKGPRGQGEKSPITIDRRKVEEEVNQAIYACDQIIDISDKARRLNKTFFSGRAETANQTRKAKIEIDRIEKLLKRRFRKHTHLIKRLGIREFLQIISLSDERSLDDFERAERDLDRYYASYVSGAQRLASWLRYSKSLLERSREEDEGITTENAPEIAERWIEDETPARYLRFKSTMEACCPEQVERLANALDRLVADESFLTDFFRKAHSLEKAVEQANTAYSRKDVDGLARIGKYITHHPDNDDTPYHIHYVDGLRAQLNEDYLLALESFEPILAAPYQPLIEHALRQTASCYLALGLGENAIQALDILSTMNPMYRRQLISALMLEGNFDLARAVGESHLAEFPTDVDMMKKIAEIYVKQGATDAARLMIDHVLGQWPEHQPTRKLLAQLDGTDRNAREK
ncbi:MAG: 6-hydroxymethylpterin diphosphokinase MptE-like protein [Halothiobacillaceae bacterium]